MNYQFRLSRKYSPIRFLNLKVTEFAWEVHEIVRMIPGAVEATLNSFTRAKKIGTARQIFGTSGR